MITMVQLMLVVLTCGLFVYWLWRQYFAKSNEPPRFCGWLPIIGHGHQIIGDLTNLWHFSKEWAEESLKLGGAVSVSLGPLKKKYVLTDPDDCWQIANMCLQKSSLYDFGKPWVGEGLVNSKPATWKRHRKILNPAFKQAALEEFLSAFNQQAARLVAALAGEAGRGPFDSTPYVEQRTLETLCATTLKVDFNDAAILIKYMEAMKQMYNIYLKRLHNVLMHNEWFYSWTSLKREQDECVKFLHNVTNTVIKKNKKESHIVDSERLNNNEHGRKFRTFIEILLEQNTAEDTLTDEEIREELDTIISAGVETTASTLTYILVFLGTYPDVQEKLYTEPVEKSDLKNLVYTEAVIKECIRLLPLFPNVARYLDRNVQLKNYTLYAGNDCVLSLYGVSRHPTWGPDAREFRPERFLDPAAVPDHPAAFAGFSFGKRNCIGKAYSVMSMKTTLAHVCRHYAVAADFNKMVLKLGIQVKPVSGHYITITKR